MMGVVRVFGKTVLQSSHTPQQSDVEEWLDRELSALQQSVETGAEAQQARNRTADARSPRRRPLPMHFGRLLRRLRQGVDRRRFEIVLYGCSVALAVAVGWLVSSMLGS
jgi:Flp pilus assembly protein TadB